MIISFQNSFISNMPSSTVCFNRQRRWLTSLRWVPEGTCRKIFPQPNPRLHSLLPSCLASQTNTLRWACEYWYTGQSNGWEKSPYLFVLSLGGEKEEKKVRTSHFFETFFCCFIGVQRKKAIVFYWGWCLIGAGNLNTIKYFIPSRRKEALSCLFCLCLITSLI